MAPQAVETGRVMITHVIFDVDGLLLDTEGLYTECFVEIFAAHGLVFDAAFKARIMGRREHEVAAYCVEHAPLPMTAEAFHQTATRALLERLPACRPMRGALELVARLAARRVPLAVATSSASDMFALKRAAPAAQGLFDHFAAVVTGDDAAVKKGKPSPDIFLEAARRLGVGAEGSSHASCLVFEDSPNGVYGAVAAGMHVIWVPDAQNHDFIAEHGALFAHPQVTVCASLDHFDLARWFP